jgi:predicted alpha/beta-hydrolase family hydrolase
MNRELRFHAPEVDGELAALLVRPERARHCLVIAHGAGAGMRHAFLEAAAARLAAHGVASFRFGYPYAEAGRRRPDPRPALLACTRAALRAAAAAAPDLPLLAGGKSMGGRMTSLAVAGPPALDLPVLRGLVFLGFPLHPAGRPSRERGVHLREVRVPMLFLQGSRDKLAELSLLEPLVGELAPAARLHVIADADHSFRVPKRAGRSAHDVQDELARVVAQWADSLA